MYKNIIDKWYKLPIKSKQLLFLTLIIIMISLISVYSNYNLHMFVNTFNENISSYYKIDELINEINFNKQAMARYIKNLEKSDYEKYQTSASKIYKYVEEIDNTSNNNLETYFLMRSIRNSIKSYFDMCNSAINLRYNESENYANYMESLKIHGYLESYTRKLLYTKLKEGSSDYSSLVIKAQDVDRFISIAIVIMCVLCLIFGIVFSNYITYPIRRLAMAAMQISKGELDIPVIRVVSKDEVSILASSFNLMKESIKQMLEDLKEKSELEKKLHEEELKNVKMQQVLKETEFLALQSQVNPHFLFNSLNTISRTIMFGHADKAKRLLQSLSNIFRYNLRNGTKMVNLSDEIDIVKEYIYIQKHRFGERLRFELKCTVNPSKVRIPCFVLQPLVENAIIHGIETCEQGGVIRIKVIMNHENIRIIISDNGSGMSKERLNWVLETKDKNEDSSSVGIGINNVKKRLEFFLKNKDCFKVRSKKGKGTQVIIYLPALKECEKVV